MQGISVEEVGLSQGSFTLVEWKRKAEMICSNMKKSDDETVSFNPLFSGKSFLGKRPHAGSLVKLENGECPMGVKKFPQLEMYEVWYSKPSNLVDALDLEEDPLLDLSFRTTLEGYLQAKVC